MKPRRCPRSPTLGTKIGSLYRFFPNKQSLADTIIVNAREMLDAEFDRFDAGVASLSISALADGLMAFVLERLNKSAAKKLLEIDQDWSVRRRVSARAPASHRQNPDAPHAPAVEETRGRGRASHRAQRKGDGNLPCVSRSFDECQE